MKPVYFIILIVVVVAAAAYMLFVSPASAPSEELVEETLPVNEEPAVTPEEEPAAEPGDTVAPEATDVGMELPIPDSEEAVVKEFTVDGFNYGYDVTEIRVQEGDTVTINLTVSDGFHDWVVDEFSAATEKIREGMTSVTFVADTAGTYEFYCSVGSHRAQGMVGTLIVE